MTDVRVKVRMLGSERQRACEYTYIILPVNETSVKL